MVYLRIALRNAEIKDNAGSQKRGRIHSHTPSQMELIRAAHFDRDLGYVNIIMEYPGFGLTEPGVKNVRERLGASGASECKVERGGSSSHRSQGGGRKGVDAR